MASPEQFDFGSPQAVQNLSFFLEDQVRMLARAQGLVPEQPADNASLLLPLMHSIQDSSETILLLTRVGKMRDGFVIARMVFETIVNTTFICAKGSDAAGRARRHALQKSFRDLNREVKIADANLKIGWTGNVDPSQDPELTKALAEFTSKKGREITSWTPETVKEQIEAIHTRYGSSVAVPLQFALLALYRHASEIAHGTLYGALFALGLTQPGDSVKSEEGLIKHYGGNFCMILLMLGISISALLRALSEEFPTPQLKELADASETSVGNVNHQPWV
jgi:hypothetical protein